MEAMRIFEMDGVDEQDAEDGEIGDDVLITCPQQAPC